ncbi:hypothetical protein WOLCODRAFT_165959 [Wolfiporia cocos MD-104 SS10]|uniref:Uncharacterized protein n=1 Tax=Wolfiporia cocos (strain MD-104) TaxID=742152 RepID=A0A2H3IYH7_WOLCO|nr:hypothetical protein WOLCODRAFT_165959 [Wolfiporia cocos MD-104 SS10]
MSDEAVLERGGHGGGEERTWRGWAGMAGEAGGNAAVRQPLILAHCLSDPNGAQQCSRTGTAVGTTSGHAAATSRPALSALYATVIARGARRSHDSRAISPIWQPSGPEPCPHLPFQAWRAEAVASLVQEAHSHASRLGGQQGAAVGPSFPAIIGDATEPPATIDRSCRLLYHQRRLPLEEGARATVLNAPTPSCLDASGTAARLLDAHLTSAIGLGLI